MTWPEPGRPTLDCQGCGKIMRILSAAEAQQVAANPYNFIVFCNTCGDHPEEGYR